MRLVSVAVAVPGLGPLTYSLPDGMRDPAVGARVLVPLGQRTVTGIVLECVTERPGPDPVPPRDRGLTPQPPKPLADVLDDDPFLPPSIIQLCRWVADYYACGIGEALATAMPPRAWIQSERRVRITDLGHARLLTEKGARRAALEALAGGKMLSVEAIVKQPGLGHGTLAALERDALVELTQPLRGAADASRTARFAVLTAQGHDVETKLGPRQAEAVALLRGAPDGIAAAAFAAVGIGTDVVARLVRSGVVRMERRRIDRDPFERETGSGIRAAIEELTAEQTAALTALCERAAQGRFETVLLHGVTGSGKTELYLRAAKHVCDAGRRVLLMVPEIALTPAAAGIFRAAFGARVAIQHSGLSDGERYDQWHRIRRGDVDVVVGTRSAVFAPLPDIGLIVVDEEHDASYKQEESPRYHGRDVAVVRGRMAGALVVLGSATPSMESFHNARSGRYALVSLRRRVLDRPMADVQVVDMREEYASGGPDVVLSTRLSDALATRLERGEQSIVLLNRRGYATVVLCRQCGDTLECPNCSVSLTVHKAAGRAQCHYCNYSIGVPKICGKCAAPYLELLGFGTERIEQEIRTLLPTARVGRVDRDTVRRRGAIAALLDKFSAGALDVLVGTQMIAKGHDFPRVTLVGVISADVGLGLADFRAAERTFQLLTQVAGRAGRGEIAGEAIVQTLHPSHYSIRHACRQDYVAFYDDEWRFREAMRYPPALSLINVVIRARTRQDAMNDASEIVSALRVAGFNGYKVLGPAPAPLGRLRGEHRVQLFLKGTHRTMMRKAVTAVVDSRPELRRRLIIDVDPMSVL
jgi:primosomal protein N' (replication factor Y) (superfamily II helicase)